MEMSGDEDALIAAEVLAHVSEAKARLTEKMRRHGLELANGWTIGELVRSTPSGHEFVFWPMHLYQTHYGLETAVQIGADGRPHSKRTTRA